MTEFEPPIALPAYFAPTAFEYTHPHYMGVTHDPELLDKFSTFMNNELGRGLPSAAEDLAFVYRFAEPGFMRTTPDPNYFKAKPDRPYIAADQLAINPGQKPEQTTKHDIEAIGKTVMQVQLAKFKPPSMDALAKSVIYPPAEDSRVIASPAAWAKQIGMAFNRAEPEENRQKIIREAVARYSGAIILQPR